MTTRYQVIRPDGLPVAEYGSYTEAGLYACAYAPDAKIKTVAVADDEIPKGSA